MSTHLVRLQVLKDSSQYSENVISQFEKIFSDNAGKLPTTFYLENVGVRTISKVLKNLNIKKFSISAPEGSKSSLREVILR